MKSKYIIEIIQPYNLHIIQFYLNQIVEISKKVVDEEELRPIQDKMFAYNNTKVRIMTPYPITLQKESKDEA